MLIKLAAGNQIYWVHEATGEPAEVVVGLTGNVEEVVDETKNPGSTERMFESFFDTELGKTFKDTFGLDTVGPSGRKNIQTAEQTCLLLYPEVSLSRFEDAVIVCISAGELGKPAPVRVTPRPRTEEDRFADKQSQLRAGIRAKLADPNTPASYFRQRAANDREFGDAWRAETEVAKASTETPIVAANADEILFSQAYRRTPSLRPNGGIVVLDYADGQHRMFSVKDFQIFVDRCIDLKLL